MRALSASDLLHIWDLGRGRSPTAQALLMLSAAYPNISPQTLANLSIGQRDGQLLRLRSHTFGPQLQATARCPQCTEVLEYNLAVQDMIISSSPEAPLFSTANNSVNDSANDTHTEPPEDGPDQPTRYHWQQGDYAISFRLPTSADVLSVSNASRETGAIALMQHCLIAVAKEGEDITLTDLPAEILSALEEQIAQQDPQADILLDLSCSSCEHSWQILFDIVVFFWREIETAAQRLLQAVHLLASTYGWHEADILNLSPRRRAAYLSQISGDPSLGQVTSPFSQAAGL